MKTSTIQEISFSTMTKSLIKAKDFTKNLRISSSKPQNEPLILDLKNRTLIKSNSLKTE
jgi:hypothetical protein